ncbi:methyl-accepting chemotaxis protein [Thiovibrio sp. JS02]
MVEYKRKKLNMAVKREFQRWLLLRIFGVVLLSSLLAALILYGYARKEVCDSFYSAHIAIRRVSDLLWPVVAAGSAVSLLSGMLLAIFLPQKIAGPIYHIERDLAAVRQGDLTVRFKLRSGDPLQDLAAQINQTIEVLRQRVKKAQEGCAEFEATEGYQQVDDSLKRLIAELKNLKT